VRRYRVLLLAARRLEDNRVRRYRAPLLAALRQEAGVAAVAAEPASAPARSRRLS